MVNILTNNRRRKKKTVGQKYMLMGLLFNTSDSILFTFYGLSSLRTFVLSTTDWSGFGNARSIGFENFRSIFSDSTFLLALKNTVYFAVFSSVFSVLAGVVLAWLNMYMRRIEGQVYRTIMFAPSMIARQNRLALPALFTED